ncbi:DUF5677 domain-containing protein [Halosimplex halobium]|uniref:DUF5677 domain-containing protein n=1 Tax=Halosimplex halobium TaxID=3396618 RepID=UPI003F57E4AF
MAEDDADWYLDVLHPVINHVSDKADSYGEITDEAEEEILDSGVDALLDELAKKHDVAVQEERQRRQRMESSIYSTWGHALDFLDFFIVLNQKARNHFETMADVDEKGENYQFDALMRLHVRALRVSREVVGLLRAGYPDGAMARWRTLYEIAAVATIIADKGEEAGERFLKFKTAKDLFRVKNDHEEYMDALGFESVDEETVEKLEERTEELTEQFGEDFDEYNGWAVDFVDRSSRQVVTSIWMADQ